LRACYEAGPTVYVVYWQLAELGFKCEAIAPTLVPVTQLGEAAALLDVRDTFDPVSASQNGVVLSQLLWVRPGSGASPASPRRRFSALDQILMAADLLLQSGGFGLVVLDLTSLNPRDTIKIPLATWFRLRRAVDETRTLLLVLEQEPHAGSSAAVILDLAQAGVKFLETRTSKATAQHVDGDRLIDSIALDAEVVRGPLVMERAHSAAAARTLACDPPESITLRTVNCSGC
jgi:hypothetical protein